MDLNELQKQVVSMIAKYGGDTIVTRADSTSFFKDIGGLNHVEIDGIKKFILIS